MTDRESGPGVGSPFRPPLVLLSILVITED
jgi:hypothetical protein